MPDWSAAEEVEFHEEEIDQGKRTPNVYAWWSETPSFMPTGGGTAAYPSGSPHAPFCFSHRWEFQSFHRCRPRPVCVDPRKRVDDSGADRRLHPGTDRQ